MSVILPRTADLPRTVEPGLTWTGGCVEARFKGDDGYEFFHQHFSAFLIEGAEKTLLVDTGHPAHSDQVLETVEKVLGDRPLDYIFPTHTEYPHAGNIARLLERYPNAEVIGIIGDYELFYPDWYRQGRFRDFEAGDSVRLGPDHDFVFLTAIWRDLPNTLWGYDTHNRTLYVADGFAYIHSHNRGQCSLYSDEMPPPKIEHAVYVNERALYWTRYVGVEKTFQLIDKMFEEYPAERVAPAHGNVITNLDDMIPRLKDGMISMKRDQERRKRT